MSYTAPHLRPPSSEKSLKGFTLLELLSVLAVGSILLTLAFAGFSKIARNGRSVQCTTNLRSLGAAASAFAAEHSQRLPVPKDWESDEAEGRWWRYFLRYVDGLKGVGAVFRCPSGAAYKLYGNTIRTPTWGCFDYTPVLSQPGGYYHYLHSIRPAVTPLLIEAENGGNLGYIPSWHSRMIPDTTLKRHSDGSSSTNGIHVLYCDGSVRRLINPTAADLQPQYNNPANKANR